jgi:hypothetical protein
VCEEYSQWVERDDALGGGALTTLVQRQSRVYPVIVAVTDLSPCIDELSTVTRYIRVGWDLDGNMRVRLTVMMSPMLRSQIPGLA